MNTRDGGNKRGGAGRPKGVGRPNSSKPKPPMQKRAQGPKKVKPDTKTADKSAEKVSEKVAKTPNQAPKRAKTNPDEIRLNKYISNSGVC